MNDNTTTIFEIRDSVKKFISDRKWEPYHTLKNLSLSIAIEAAELMENFQWLDTDECNALLQNKRTKNQVTDELADILIYCICFANAAEINIASAINQKMTQNETRFPIGKILKSTQDN